MDEFINNFENFDMIDRDTDDYNYDTRFYNYALIKAYLKTKNLNFYFEVCEILDGQVYNEDILFKLIREPVSREAIDAVINRMAEFRGWSFRDMAAYIEQMLSDL